MGPTNPEDVSDDEGTSGASGDMNGPSRETPILGSFGEDVAPIGGNVDDSWPLGKCRRRRTGLRPTEMSGGGELREDG